MSDKLISANNLLKHTVLAGEIRNPYMEVVPAYFARESPAVDAVEVVRCGDCRYYHQYYAGNFKEATGWGRCTLISMDIDMTVVDYCSYGERREGNETY